MPPISERNRTPYDGKRFAVLLGGGGVLALCYLVISWIFSTKLIAQKFAPLGPVNPADYGLPPPEAVRIPGDGVTLAGWYFANPQRADRAVVMLHGFAGSKGGILIAAPLFWERGCDLLLYDARGHGDSSPALLTYGAHERRDLLRAIDWLAAKGAVPRARIGLIGWSYGAATALQAAAEVRELAFVVADSSYSSLGDIARAQADQQFGARARAFVPGALLIASLRGGFDARDVAPNLAIQQVQAPVFLVHSRQDAFTPAAQSERIYARSNKARTRLLIPAWAAEHGHSYGENPGAYTAAVDGFLTTFVPAFGSRGEQ